MAATQQIWQRLNAAYFEGCFLLPVLIHGDELATGAFAQCVTLTEGVPHSRILLSWALFDVSYWYALPHGDRFLSDALLHELMHMHQHSRHIGLQSNGNHLSPEWVAECRRVARLLGIEVPHVTFEFTWAEFPQSITSERYYRYQQERR